MDNSPTPIRSAAATAASTRALELAEVWAELEKIVGPEYFRAAGPDDAIDRVQPQKIAEPANSEQLGRLLAVANDAGLRVAPRGAGSKLSWGNPPRGLELVISTRRLNGVLEHAWADLTVTVEAGCRFADLQRILAQHGQWLALDPLWPAAATIGGILATNDSGALRVRFGSLRDLIIGITLALPDGTLARSGGKVVKNVAGYDLPKLATGSLGTLGIITQAVFRLHPLPQQTRTVSFTGNIHDLNGFALAVLDSRLVCDGLQLQMGSGENACLDVGFAGVPSGIEAQTESLMHFAGRAQEVESSESAWNARHSLWQQRNAALIVKLTVLPSEIARVCDATDKLMAGRGTWRIVAQAVGVGLLRLQVSDSHSSPAPLGEAAARKEESERDLASYVSTGAGELLLEVLSGLRAEVARNGGSVVVLDCPAELKPCVDVWGYSGDVLGLMTRVKQQFDPAGTLNPGRFVGGL